MEIAFVDIAYESPQRDLGNRPTRILKTLTITCTEEIRKTGKLPDCIATEVARKPT